MKISTFTFLILVLSLSSRDLISQNLYINEFLASNSTVITDDFGEHDDWIEIFNAESFPVDIGGMFVTDDLSEPDKWQIPATAPGQTTIPAGGFLVVWFDGDPVQGVLHVDTKLSAGGEDIGLYAPDGTPIDELSFGPQTPNISYGRTTDGGNVFQFFSIPTPGTSNNSSAGGDKAEIPTSTIISGFYNNPFGVDLFSATAGADIRYTLDGSEPTSTSPLYMGPIFIQQNTTLRAKAFATGLLPSSTATFNYLFDDQSTFPVVALSFEDDDFFDPATGIYPNYEEDWERPVNISFFETDGAMAFNQSAIVEIHGTGSASLPQKSLKVKALSSGGSGYFEHPVFPDEPFDKYKRFIMRNSGQDWNYTMFHDAFVASLSKDLSDVGGIIQPPDLLHQAFRPGVVYLNGEYWGIHNLREHMQAKYIEQHFGLSDNEIDLLDNFEVKEGSDDEWNNLIQFLSGNDFSDDAKLEQLAQMVDLPHWLDYHVFNIIIDNSDWPGNNYRRWREKNNGLWRFLTFDLDFTFGLYNFIPNSTPTWNTGEASANALARALDDSQINWPNPADRTLPFRKPLENDNFRRDYINRTADFLNVLFEPTRVNNRISDFENLYQPEIQRHLDKWNSGWNPFQQNVEVLRRFANERTQYMQQHVTDAFDEVTGTTTITLQSDPPGAGTIEFSTLHLSDDHLPWAGEYFMGVDIPVTAVPDSGYVFTGWSGTALGNAISTTINLSGDVVLTAHFSTGSGPQPQTIDFPAISDKFTTDQPFGITATATSGLPVEFTIQSGPATINGNIITLDGTVGLVFVQATQPGNSLWEAAPPVTRAFRILLPPSPTAYCEALGEEPWQEWIGRVTFANLDYISGKNQYGDFTNATANVIVGQTNTLTVQPSFSWQSYHEHIRAWIDFNQDFDFDDPGELVLEATGIGAVSANVLIPDQATLGETRMRVAMQRDQFAEPCDTFILGEVEDYTIHIEMSDLATQTIDFQPVPDQNSSAQPFSIFATATSGLPVSFTIVSGPASVNGNTVTLAGVPGIVTIRATQNGNAQWQAAPPVEQSFTVSGTPTPPGTYCDSGGEEPWLEWIERVEFGGIDHFSFKDQYGDFTNVSTVVGKGVTVSLQVTPAFSWEIFAEYFRVWIDFNRDFDFDDPGEMVLEMQGTGPVSADVVIPTDAVLGPTQMRVSMQRDQFADACEDFITGEVEDYTIIISDNFNDSGTESLNLKIAPNPANYLLNASFHIYHEGDVQLTIVNSSGIEVLNEKRFFQKGHQRISLDIASLKDGLYMLFLQPERQKATTGKFMKADE